MSDKIYRKMLSYFFRSIDANRITESRARTSLYSARIFSIMKEQRKQRWHDVAINNRTRRLLMSNGRKKYEYTVVHMVEHVDCGSRNCRN